MIGFLAGWIQAQPTTPPPPPAITVSATAADTYPHAVSHFDGVEFDPATQQVKGVKRDEPVFALGQRDDAINLGVVATSNGADRTFHLVGKITDYKGNPLQDIAADLSVKAGATAAHAISFKPTIDQLGPYYLRGTWTVADGEEKGEFALAVGQANARFVVNDFEQPDYPDPAGPLFTSADAKHSGATGLLVKLPTTPLPPNATPEQKKAPPVGQISIPLNATLPGRPTKIGVWIKTQTALQLITKWHDPGIDAQQRNIPDNWIVGPIAIEPGDWRYIEIPAPGYSKPESERKQHGEANGVLDYPLTLESIDFAGPGEATLAIDRVECWTQTEKDQTLAMRPLLNKPGGLLSRTDRVSIVVSNGWLWEPQKTTWSASLRDVKDQERDANGATVDIAPGDETTFPIELKDLPIGPYRFIAKAEVPGAQAADATVELPVTRLLVYEPTGKPLPPLELHRLLGDRNRLLADLGFKRDLVMVPWHSVDNSPSVEPFPGYWAFDWIAPTLKATHDAGVDVVGTLGFTPLWADPSATFNRKMGAWYGSTTGMPSRTIYWEEYVRRTTEELKGVVNTWVVWDRPDVQSFNATPEEYAEKMLDVAHRAALEGNPNSKLVSGAITRESIESFVVALADVGADKYLAGIGILPSTSPLSPEDGFMDVLLARAQRTREQEHVQTPLWALNLAWPSGEDAYHVSEIDQAVYVPRAYILCRAQGIDQILLKPDMTEANSKRDSADLIYPEGKLWAIKPAAISAKTVRQTLDDATFVREVFLNDRTDGLARAHLFKRADGRVLLAAWRREGTSVVPLPIKPEAAIDAFGNLIVTGEGNRVTLSTAPTYVTFAPGTDADSLARGLERASIEYDDAPESAWKRGFTFHLDVGDEADEKAADYKVTGGELVGPIDSYYHNDYGRHVIDTGRHYTGEESFSIDTSAYGKSDLLLRKRINYAESNQMVKVYCNDQYVGQWFAFKRDRRYRWRDIELVIPNKFFTGGSTARLRFVAQGEPKATSYAYWAGPLATKTMYVSDLSHLVATSGYGAGPNRDKNILGGPIKFFKKPDETYNKGIGTNAAAALADSLMVLSLNKQYSHFKATVGIDAATNGQGSVRFRIGDGTKMLWDSGEMTYYSDPKEIDLDVSDAIILMLWTDDAGDGHRNDIADWANARLELK